jgi:hypothetical protein
MDADVGLVGRRKWMQWWQFISGRFSLLTAETGFGMAEYVGVNLWPVLGGCEADVGFEAAMWPPNWWL